MSTEILHSIKDIDAHRWDQMLGDNNTPFMRHAFLLALENHSCEPFGWFPRHVIHKDEDRILAAMPMYVKNNSYGEFVFDWSWADAYERSGLAYYPKLVSAVPYTPITGPRLLIDPSVPQIEAKKIVKQIINGTLEYALSENISSLHVLFPEASMARQLESIGLLPRIACQFHWHNRQPRVYADFDDFLQQLSSRKRKNIVRERKTVQQTPLQLRISNGEQSTEEQWQQFHRHYSSTFYRLGGYPTLSLEFFQEIAQTLPQETLLFQAYDGNRIIASAFCMRDRQHLYGRHWGCDEAYNNLHFELCYYQGIEYCIREQLLRFEPGAQGEHKISRGFLPTLTHSAHWIAHPEFRQIIAAFLEREQKGIRHYRDSLIAHSPYKQAN
ncbi:MAG: GNAT family N-acetyltransferase [Gammaproteobacteria bacterium]|nr:GNAT family N-acetyltransferase [Gammaproteobacteria bacterium]MDH5801881.1 GNAT family N-acetyltransferase [Gammaproteobacteria bacterium]